MTRFTSVAMLALAVASTHAVAGGRRQGDNEVPSPSLSELVVADWVDHDLDYAAAKIEAERNVRGVTTAEDAAGGCDGIKNGKWGFHTASSEQDPWWQVDLGRVHRLDRVVIFNRTDSGRAARTGHIRVLVADDAKSPEFKPVYAHNGETFFGVKKKPLVVNLKEKNVTARLVRLHVPGRCSFALDEVEVYATDDPQKNIALNKPADQKSVGPYSYPGTLGVPPKVGSGDAFPLEHAREVISRGTKLAARLRSAATAKRLEPLAVKLEQLNARLKKLEAAKDVPESARKEVYLDARRLVRRIAFCNPLLDIDKLLFIERHHPGGPYHMCDQYYGCNAKPGGGLFVLHDPLSDDPKLVNVLESSVVEAGRLKGQKLARGAFLSPELSYDGKTILFAYSECKAKKTYQWAPEYSFHIFRVNADGTGLLQLTDGPADDFDPCFLPNGRVAFVTERRGGYLRCGRHCPTYTMYSMADDGSDITCLSFHETHEWHPSVTHDGMIAYTRWDYVDRDTNVAHHIWTCYPDGRDPRSFHGNYPERRESRPWMEMSIRAIPGSPTFVATAAAHHGHAFGSLVQIDPRPEDDGATSQLVRLTPEVPFPEAERNKRPIRECMVYGTAWPLSEEDYLCAYDRHAKNHGIYWIDRYGNKELLYRNPSVPSMSPIPLRPRTKPPVIPDRTTQTAAAQKAAGADRPATISLMNVYDSDFEWPEGTRIEALRIIQVLPKTTPPPNQPRIGIAQQTNARAVLGTVPVEADGSAHFEAPVGKLVYFQALDERGFAVQSMRSGTYVHPGEQMTCQGCHETKRRSPQHAGKLPLALRRTPSKIQPDVDGSSPFSYVRLVQPVLDRNCVACHKEKKALDLSGTIQKSHGWTQSYVSLAEKYGFYFHVQNGAINTGVHGGTRTIAGQFGARASKLLEYMDDRHHGVKLSPEDFHRLTLWLDCNSEFYGSYENTEAQARGEVVEPTLN